MSAGPETVSIVTVSPDCTVSTGSSAASKKPQWQVAAPTGRV
ncbi:MAG: hypothetical protein WDN69_02690 [Aliidongia sp.]